MIKLVATFEDRAGLSSGRVDALRAIAAGQCLLQHVVAWMGVCDPTPDIVKIVEQDEFTNDVVIAVSDAWLVYDCS